MIKSVVKAMDILTVLSGNKEKPMPLSELSERTGINKSTCAHIVDTLCEGLYVERVSRSEGYRLGPWAYMLSRFGTFRQPLVNAAAPVVRWLHEKLQTDVFISVLCNGRKYIVYHIETDNVLPMRDGTMIQGYIEPTATGRLLMAYLSREELYHLLNRNNNGTRAEPSAEITEELRRIRSCGYAYLSVDVEHSQSYAFRIVDGTATVASLGVLFYNSKDSPEFREAVIKAGKTAANEISHRLAFT